jgi:hypothetical protein
MVNSATYRQSAMIDPQNELHAKAAVADPSNRLLWHARRQRLTGEALRDAVLQVSGDLDLRMYGPSAHPQLPDGLGNYAWKPDANSADRNRRSIYVIAKRNLRLPLLDAFDLPDMHNSCARRSTTTTAPQALLMLNSEFTLLAAERWAERLEADLKKAGKAVSDDRPIITAAYRETYAREPSDADLEMCSKFIARQATALSNENGASDKAPTPTSVSNDAAHKAAIIDFCHAILNSNEFLYVD